MTLSTKPMSGFCKFNASFNQGLQDHTEVLTGAASPVASREPVNLGPAEVLGLSFRRRYLQALMRLTE